MNKSIKLKRLKYWLIDYITNTIHDLKTDNDSFNNWAKNFKREEAAFVVNMEYSAEYGYDERLSIPIEEVKEFADILIKSITDRWYI